ncbi:histidine kinase N-terminal 7TM domain-containing protein [Haloparvum sp. PAK95]|uniref:histidine kinase N-terminal 7TM domain-containing protein n=1 Tax=Haloparvum sp. PAK95 TaxID=3418962 RepID=UPI003D2F4099
MSWEVTAFTAPFGLVSAALLALAVALARAARRETDTGAYLVVALIAGTALWVFLYTLQVSQTAPAASVFIGKLEIAALTALPPIWLAYVFWYTGYQSWLTPRVFGPIVGLGLVIVLGVATNEAHLLFWERVWLPDSPVNSFEADHGPLFVAHVAYVYSLLTAATLLLAATALGTRGVLRAQSASLLAFSLAPALAGVADAAGYAIAPGLDLAALATVVTALAGAVSLFRFRWLELQPITRDHVLSVMAEPTLVVDGDGDVIDHNPRAAALFTGDADGDFVGRRIDEIAPEIGAILSTRSTGGNTETTLATAEGRKRFEVTITRTRGRGWNGDGGPVGASDGGTGRLDGPGTADGAGAVLLLHDVTERAAAQSDLAAGRATMKELVQVGCDLSAATEAKTVHERTVHAARDLIDADHCRLLDGEDWTTLASTGKTGAFDDALSATIAERVADAGSAHVVSDLTIRGATVDAVGDTDGESETPDGPDTLGSATGIGTDADVGADDGPDPIIEETFGSLASVPVEGVGVLQVFDRDVDAFEETDVETLRLLSAHVTTASEQVDTEAELREERDRLEEFASVVSHDLRNPLSVATGYLELAREEPTEDHFDRIGRALDQMDDLLDDLLQLARHGESIGETEPVDLQTVVRDAWGMVETGDATLRLDGDLGTAEVDRARVVELFANLFSNSIEHGSDGGKVTVRVTREGDRISVSDDGPGIPVDVRNEVLERGVSTSEGGTGFGLAIVDEVAEAHGWTVEVDESESGGAQFDILDVE